MASRVADRARERSGILAFFAPVCREKRDRQEPRCTGATSPSASCGSPHCGKNLRGDDDDPGAGSSSAQRKRSRGLEVVGDAGAGENGAPDYLVSLRRRVMRRLADSTNRGAAAPRSKTVSPFIAVAHAHATAAALDEHCVLCDAPSRFCVCDSVGDSSHALPAAMGSRMPSASAARRGMTDSDGDHANDSEEETHLRRQMLRVLLRLEKQGVWLTSEGNKRGVGSACCTSYCRTTREFSTENVLRVKAMAVPDKVWGDGKVFRTTSRLSQVDSYQWKNLLEAALEQSSSESGSPRRAARRRSCAAPITNGELIMGFALADLSPSFGNKSGREVNAKFKAKLV
jgi:hypothetical protein